MQEKLDYYDILGNVVPGLVLVGGTYMLASWLGYQLTLPPLPDALTVFVVVAIALVLGQVIQALSSILEPFYYWTWGGQPSERLLSGQTRKFSVQYLDALKKRLRKRMLEDEERDVEITNRDLFLYSLAVCNRNGLGRTSRFNSLYAYHRALTTLGIFFLVVTILMLFWAQPSPHGKKWVLGVECLSTALLWHRTRQRGEYFVDEVIRMAADVG
jgi:hypothetical protein